MEGAAPSVDAPTRRRLARGELAIESRVDLHGLDREAARGALERCLTTSRALGHRVVLVIHGRGLRSDDGEAVLQKLVPEWLSGDREGAAVLALASATSRHGGSGALYVLLRKS